MKNELVPNRKKDALQLICQQKADKVQYEELSFSSLDNSKKISIKLGYRRCKNFDQSDSAGHDFAIVQADQEHVVGIVADGVSQSFFGNIAAEFVAKKFLEMLWENRYNPLNYRQTESFLASIQKAASTKVNNFVIPQHLSPSLRHILEDVRRKEGSKTVFTGFLLDITSTTAYLYKVGDVVTFVQLENGGVLPVESDPTGCWSTLGQNRLKLHTQTIDLTKGILLKSDGIKNFLEEAFCEEYAIKGEFITLAEQDSIDDDVSFVAVHLNQNTDISRLVSTPNQMSRNQPNRTYSQLMPLTPTEEIQVYVTPATSKETVSQNRKVRKTIQSSTKSEQIIESPKLSNRIFYVISFLVGILVCLIVLNSGFLYDTKRKKNIIPTENQDLLINATPVPANRLPQSVTKQPVNAANTNSENKFPNVDTANKGDVTNLDKAVSVDKRGSFKQEQMKAETNNENIHSINTNKTTKTSDLEEQKKYSTSTSSNVETYYDTKKNQPVLIGSGDQLNKESIPSHRSTNSVNLTTKIKIVEGKTVKCIERDEK